jgi:hypothetical protein
MVAEIKECPARIHIAIRCCDAHSTSEMGQKQTWRPEISMSALPPKADIGVPIESLISASKQCRRHIKVGPRLSFLRPRGAGSSSLRRLKPMARNGQLPRRVRQAERTLGEPVSLLNPQAPKR